MFISTNKIAHIVIWVHILFICSINSFAEGKDACWYYQKTDEAFSSNRFDDCIDYAQNAITQSNSLDSHIECEDGSIINDYDPYWYLTACNCNLKDYLSAYKNYSQSKYEISDEYADCIARGSVCTTYQNAIENCNYQDYQSLISTAKENAIKINWKVKCSKSISVEPNLFKSVCYFAYNEYMCSINSNKELCAVGNNHCYWNEESNQCISSYPHCEKLLTESQCNAAPKNPIIQPFAGNGESVCVLFDGEERCISTLNNFKSSSISDLHKHPRATVLDIKAGCFWYGIDGTCYPATKICEVRKSLAECEIESADCIWDNEDNRCETIPGCSLFSNAESCVADERSKRCYWNVDADGCYRVSNTCASYLAKDACRGANIDCVWYDAHSRAFAYNYWNDTGEMKTRHVVKIQSPFPGTCVAKYK